MKKLTVILSILLMSAVSLCGCKDNSNYRQIELDTPVVTYSNGVISWNEIEDADKYEVSINNEIHITYNCNYTIPLTEETQSFDIQVKSISQEFLDSKFSELISIEAKLLNKIDSISINIDNKNDKIILSWKSLNTNEYAVYINDKKYLTNSTELITHSNNYLTGENTVSVQPVGNPYDAIPEPTLVIVEKSNPLLDTANIRIEDGTLLYGINSVFNTEDLPSGEYSTITICNIEQGKIKSDGPTFTAYKVNSPKITGALRGNSINNSYRYVEVEGIAPDDCDFVKIEVLSSDLTLMTSGMCSFGSSNIFGITFDITDIPYYANYVHVTACKAGCLNSNMEVSSIA